MYKFKNDIDINTENVDPEVVAKHLNMLKKTWGFLKPSLIVDDARDPRSPIHKCFVWDDSLAAERFRQYQARQLIKAVVVVKDVNSKPIEIRAFVSVKDEDGDNVFDEIEAVMSDDHQRIQLLRKAYGELLTWKKKYQNLMEFATVFGTIESLKIK